MQTASSQLLQTADLPGVARLMAASGLPCSAPHSQVEDPHGTILHESTGKAEGQFAFTSKQAGEYKACFAVRGKLPCDVQKHQEGLGYAWSTTGW